MFPYFPAVIYSYNSPFIPFGKVPLLHSVMWIFALYLLQAFLHRWQGDPSLVNQRLGQRLPHLPLIINKLADTIFHTEMPREENIKLSTSNFALVSLTGFSSLLIYPCLRSSVTRKSEVHFSCLYFLLHEYSKMFAFILG